MSTSLVLGNGESRQKYNWQSLSYDDLIACNAAHRDYIVDHLVCCDRRMVQEATQNPQNTNTFIYVRSSNYHHFRKINKNKNIKILPDIPFVGEFKRDQPDHWGSGPYAVLLGSKLNDTILMVGFDLYGNNNKINNVYKGTPNYNKEESQAVDHSYWVHQIAQVFRYNNDKQFTIVNEKKWIMPNEWLLSNVTFKNFEDIFIDNKYLCN